MTKAVVQHIGLAKMTSVTKHCSSPRLYHKIRHTKPVFSLSAQKTGLTACESNARDAQGEVERAPRR